MRSAMSQMSGVNSREVSFSVFSLQSPYSFFLHVRPSSLPRFLHAVHSSQHQSCLSHILSHHRPRFCTPYLSSRPLLNFLCHAPSFFVHIFGLSFPQRLRACRCMPLAVSLISRRFHIFTGWPWAEKFKTLVHLPASGHSALRALTLPCDRRSKNNASERSNMIYLFLELRLFVRLFICCNWVSFFFFSLCAPYVIDRELLRPIACTCMLLAIDRRCLTHKLTTIKSVKTIRRTCHPRALSPTSPRK